MFRAAVMMHVYIKFRVIFEEMSKEIPLTETTTTAATTVEGDTGKVKTVADQQSTGSDSSVEQVTTEMAQLTVESKPK